MAEAGVILADEAVLRRVDRQGVGVARALRSEADRATNAGLGAVGGVQIDLHGGEVVAGQALRDVFDFLAREGELGRETVGPVGEQLSLVGLQVRDDLIGRGQQTDRDVVAAGRRIVQAQVAAFGLLVGDDGAMAIVDVPVQLGEVLLVIGFQRARTPVQRIIAIDGRGDLTNLIDLSLGDALGLVGQASALRAGQNGRGALELFVVQQEEQAVLDDRTAERGAPGLFFELADNRAVLTLAGDEVFVAEGLAAQVLVGLLVEEFTVEVVAAGLGDRVDHAAGEGAVLNAVRRHIDADRLDDRTRDRRTQRGVAVLVQTEIVVLAHAVDQDGVETRVLAADRQGVVVGRIDRGERGGANNVLDVATDRRKRLDVRQVQVAARRGAQTARADARNHDISHLGGAVRSAGDNQLNRCRSTDPDGRDLGDRIARRRGAANGVGAADAQTARRERAVLIRNGRRSGARRLVCHRHGRARDRRAGRVIDSARDAARGFLGIHRRRGGHHDGDGRSAVRQFAEGH